MKPARFDYFRPTTVQEALRLLAEDPDETKVLAGGQSLIPIMNFRLGRPERLVDINILRELAGIETVGDVVRIGALTRHRTIERSDLPGPLGQLLRRASHYIGHLPIRTRGTFGGSLAHSDAASEWCLIAVLLDAEITAQSAERGTRTIAAGDFFEMVFSTALEPDELLTEVRLPSLHPNYRTGIAEFARRAGDFAVVAATTAVRVDDGVVTDARVCLGGVAEIPFRSRAAEAALLGGEWSEELVEAAVSAAAAEVQPPSDAHGDGEFRRDLMAAQLRRSLLQEPQADQRDEEVSVVAG